MDNKKRNISIISEILPDVIKNISRTNAHEQIELETLWLEMVNTAWAGGSAVGVKFSGFKEGTVFITVDGSARLYHWKLRRTAVLRRFQEQRPDVKNIVFKIGTVL
ncbi:MAG: hypothetical protein WCI27_02575 [Candidatus Omnitrophota bacterium]